MELVGKARVSWVMVCGGAKHECEKVIALTVVSQLAWLTLRRIRRGERANTEELHVYNLHFHISST